VVSRAEDGESLELADRALGFALAAGASEAEALVMREDGALTRFANSEIHQNVAQREVAVNLRVVIGKRVGVASSGRSDDEGLRTLAAKAVAIARVVEELPDWGGLAMPRPLDAATDGFDADTASATPEFRAEAVRQVIAAADAVGVTAYGSFSTGIDTTAVANSNGVRVAGSRTTATRRPRGRTSSTP